MTMCSKELAGKTKIVESRVGSQSAPSVVMVEM
jgi:hypothetical protein